MPLQHDMKIISVDDHSDRAPASVAGPAAREFTGSRPDDHRERGRATMSGATRASSTRRSDSTRWPAKTRTSTAWSPSATRT